MVRHSLHRWLTRPAGGWARITRADALFTGVLTLFACFSAAGWTGSNAQSPHAGFAAAVAVTVMTAPVLVARRWPVPVCAVLAAGAALNAALIGDLVRCGAGLIAVFYAAFVLGTRCRILPAGAGVALLSVNIACQAWSDPQLGADVIVYMVPITAAFAAAGWLVGARNAVVVALRAETAALRTQREENARLAVATEQARIATDLDGFLAMRVDRMGRSAAEGRAALMTAPEQAREVFEEIGRSGRAVLTRMRDVVADLTVGRDGVEPAPVLAQLDRVLAEAGEGPARLQVLGDPRVLPAGLELAAYRIVERLLEVTDRDAAAGRSAGGVGVSVVVAFTSQELRLTVSGPSTHRTNVRAALAAASERARLNGGCLESSIADRRRTTVVSLPFVTHHV